MTKFFKLFGIACLVLALLLLWQRNNSQRIVFKEFPQVKKNKQSRQSPPSRIVIKKVNIDLPLFPAKIVGQRWDLTNKGASWLDFSPIPGDRGNSILYGHNWTNLLGNLIFVRPGAEIEIFYKDGSHKIFIVDGTATVNPDNVSVLSQTNDSRITIYTCTGLFDQKRYIVAASLKDL
ncbi:sortase [Candidatus Roizmanbacteria bacterium]|nr:sortase [Candidatus Roizmanbacteria bacterium]